MDVKVPIGSVVHLYSLSWSYPSIIISSFVPSSCQARSNPISCGNIPSLTSHMQLRFLYYFLNPFLSSVFPKLLLAAGAESFIPFPLQQTSSANRGPVARRAHKRQKALDVKHLPSITAASRSRWHPRCWGEAKQDSEIKLTSIFLLQERKNLFSHISAVKSKCSL